MTIGSQGWTQVSGQFLGGSDSIEINRFLNVSSGTFRATSGQLRVGNSIEAASWTILRLGAGVIFNHNSGTFVLNPGSWPNDILANVDIPTATTLNLQNFKLTHANCNGSGGATLIIPSGVIFYVSGNAEFGSTPACGGDTNMYRLRSQGAFELEGNLIVGDNIRNLTAYFGTQITMVGTALQTYQFQSNTGHVGDLVINKSGGSVSPAGGTTTASFKTLTVTNGTFNAPSTALNIHPSMDQTLTYPTNFDVLTVSPTGTIVWGTTVLSIYLYWTGMGDSPSLFRLNLPDGYQIPKVVLSQYDHIDNRVYYSGPVAGRSIEVTQLLTIGTDALTNASGASVNIKNDWRVSGNLEVGKEAGSSNFGPSIETSGNSVTFIGTAAQTYRRTGTSGLISNMVINKTGGSVTAASADFAVQRLEIQSGAFTAPAGILTMWNRNGNMANVSLLNISATGSFTHNNGTANFAMSESSCTANALFSIDLANDLSLWNMTTDGGTDGGCSGGRTSLTMNGANINVGNQFSMNTGSNGFYYMYMNGRNLTVSTASFSLNSNLITKSLGVLDVNAVVQGTGALFGGTVSP